MSGLPKIFTGSNYINIDIIKLKIAREKVLEHLNQTEEINKKNCRKVLEKAYKYANSVYSGFLTPDIFQQILSLPIQSAFYERIVKDPLTSKDFKEQMREIYTKFYMDKVQEIL